MIEIAQGAGKHDEPGPHGPDRTAQGAGLRHDPEKTRRERTTTKRPTELATILDFIRKGDTLVVTRIDRLPRPVANLQD
jgi:DNA invertase Pin-like site-specific DNA recombinase